MCAEIGKLTKLATLSLDLSGNGVRDGGIEALSGGIRKLKGLPLSCAESHIDWSL